MEDINNLIDNIKAQLDPMRIKSLYLSNAVSKQLLHLLKELADFILVYQKNTILCKYKYLQLWRRYTMYLEGDLLIAAFLATRSTSLNKYMERFDWKIVIDHDNKALNSILMQGMVDNHYHLGGSLLIFQCTWVNLMQDERYRNRIIRLSNEMHMLTKVAMIRKLLVEFLNTRGITIGQKKCQESIEDYYEERKFLYYIIRELINENNISDFKEIDKLFYNYLLIKEWIRVHVVQSGDNIGAQAFGEVNRIKNIILESSNNSGQIVRSSVYEHIRSNYIKSLEVRIKMKESSAALYKYMVWLEQQIGSFGVNVKYIICLSRNPSLEKELVYRDQSKRKEVIKQQKELITFLKTYHTLAPKVVGVDICSKESNYKPEVFTEVMTRRKKGLDTRLKRMYHTGEEYTDLLSGLRAVDECISFFKLGAGDRLGHAAPIFESVTEWYNSRKNQVTISKEDYIDNIVWLYCNVSLEAQKEKIGEVLLRNFKKQFCELYCDVFSEESISKLNPNIKSCINMDEISIFHYSEAWNLRSLKPEEIKSAIQNNNCKGSLISYYIAYCYFYSLDVKKRGLQSIDLYLSNDHVELISSAQRYVLKKIKAKKICIEICPSSSIFLGTAKNGYCHPIINHFKCSRQEYKKTDICISINTDDQGIFSTSLMNEYSLITNAFEKEICSKEGEKGLYKWVNDLRKNSITMCKETPENSV